MKYTEEKIESMGDHEITLTMVNKLGFPYENLSGQSVRHIGGDSLQECYDFTGFNPCTNWNDIMPIAEEYGISLNFRLGQKLKPLAKFDDNTFSVNPNPKRAICEVFLMMELT